MQQTQQRTFAKLSEVVCIPVETSFWRAVGGSLQVRGTGRCTRRFSLIKCSRSDPGTVRRADTTGTQPSGPRECEDLHLPAIRAVDPRTKLASQRSSGDQRQPVQHSEHSKASS